MSAPCDKLESFVDGELPPVDAENFRHHLAQCGTCPPRMQELLALELLADDVLHPAEVKEPPRPLRARARWAWVAAPLALAASLAVVMVVSRRADERAGSALWLAQAPTRSLEARLTHPGADRHRPYEVMRGAPDASQALSLRELARLEDAGDKRGIAAAYLLRGELVQAAPFLDALAPSPDASSDRAVLALARGAPEEALALAEQALKERPQHPQALWNRGLALRALGLFMTAAGAFEQVAALKEPGWSDEAARRAVELRTRAQEEKKSWEGAWESCRRMVTGGTPMSVQEARTVPGMARLCLYDGLRTADSPERAEALRELAAALDAHDGGSDLEDAVRRTASRRDFAIRRPLAQAYAQLSVGTLPPGELTALLPRLREARQEDQLLGALVFVQDARTHLAEYQALAREARDPWFTLLALERRTRAAVMAGEPRRAQALTPEVLRACGEDARPAYRCITLLRELALLEGNLHHLVEAHAHALSALQRARAGHEWGQELRLLQELGQTARMRGELALAHAYTEEAIQRSPDNCAYTELAYTGLATAFHRALDFPAARAQLDRAARCDTPPSLARLFVLADLARTPLRRPEDEALLRKALDALRTPGALDAGEDLLLRHIEGRFFLELDRARGQALLRQTLTESAPLLATTPNARKARVYTYTSLILDAARHGEFEQGMALIAEELGLSTADRCLLGVTVDDERTFVAALGADGRRVAHYDDRRRTPLSDVTGLIPPDVLAALRDCPSIQVVARPPVQGQAGLLPSEFAWSYQLGPPQPFAPAVAPRRLVVSDVVPPAELRLPELQPWHDAATEGDAPIVLRGPAATPSRVLEAMRDATEVQIHAHGLIDPGMSDASVLVLSPESEGGRFALTAADVQASPLRGHPVVVLAACHAAHATAYIHENFGLPLAFVTAGARAVLAATQVIPDSEASAFFTPVLSRIRAGEPAAPVLRDARRTWLVAHPGATWVEQVLLFE
ncbi:CHAT domain-containing protein [Corallococcus sp. M34]|uniref:CHAT domain-containing protein n=1 Tax=Citreicoccus inhibens TaxID=2849499 RepID=UPI001C23D2CE|nr:CHAT domain-containing protein [Citreicoccus inhibens]MBU8898117.1 CHAT domain-containing protein [Citreicoccus inhibens]